VLAIQIGRDGRQVALEPLFGSASYLRGDFEGMEIVLDEA